jgi:hypothetical protein
VACDSFFRYASSGWGAADTGGAWNLVGAPANWSVAPNAGTVIVGPSGQERADLAATAIQDAEILSKVVLPRSSQGNNDVAYVLGRYVAGSTDTYYRVGVGQGAGTSTMLIRGQRSDGTYLAGDVDTRIPAASGAVVWLRVQFQGVKPTAIRARAWLDGTPEPIAAWMLDTTDANAAEQVAAAVGVRDRNEDNAQSHTFTHAGLQVTALPAVGSLCPSGTLACDSFNRTAANGWGNADNGGAWSNTGSIYSVMPGQGIMAVNSTAPGNFLTGVSIQDVDARLWISMPTLFTTGDAGIAVRYLAAGGTYYQVSVYYPSATNASNYVVQLKRKPENVQINPDFSTTIAGGTAVWIRMQAMGTNPTTLRWKIWQDGTAEPSAWTATGTDSNAAEQGPGGVGVEGYVGGGTANMVFNSLSAGPPAP